MQERQIWTSGINVFGGRLKFFTSALVLLYNISCVLASITAPIIISKWLKFSDGCFEVARLEVSLQHIFQKISNDLLFMLLHHWLGRKILLSSLWPRQARGTWKRGWKMKYSSSILPPGHNVLGNNALIRCHKFPVFPDFSRETQTLLGLGADRGYFLV